MGLEEHRHAIRTIVDKAQEVRAQIATVSLQELLRNYGRNWDEITAAARDRWKVLRTRGGN